MNAGGTEVKEDERWTGGILSVWFFVGRTSRPSPLAVPIARNHRTVHTRYHPPSPLPCVSRPAIAHGMAPFSVSV